MKVIGNNDLEITEDDKYEYLSKLFEGSYK